MSTPQITVFTHGFGCTAGSWSNHNTSDDPSGEFAYDPESLISKISELKGGANIYWAKFYTDYDTDLKINTGF